MILVLLLFPLLIGAGYILFRLYNKTQSQGVNQQLVGALSEIGALKEALRAIEAMQKDIHTSVAQDKKMQDILQQHIGETLKTVEKIKTDYEARRAVEEETRGYIRRMTDIIAGTKTKGAAGENILREAFKAFPPSMVKNNFRVRGREVEFGLVLNDNKIMPIDSKWPAADLLEEFSKAQEEAERARISERIEREVIKRISEVAQYIDISVTSGWAVAAIPDVAYFVLRKAHNEAFEKKVILMPYSMAVPYILTHFMLHLQYSSAIDAENLEQYLVEIKRNLSFMEEVLENKLEKASTMLDNATGEYRRALGAVRNSIASLESARPRDAKPVPADTKGLEV